MPSTDSSLLEQWTRGRDAEAFRELVSRYAAMVHATARRLLKDPARAEDVAQDCFLKLVEAPEDTSNLPAWLHRVATNRSLDLLRAEKRRRENESRWTRPESPAGESAWEDVEPLVDDAIDRLPEDLRAPIVLHFLGGRTHEAVASVLGISKATVSYRIGKGIEGIRASLRKRGVLAAPAALAGWLSAQAAGAAPEGLIAALGKMALAGPEAAASRGDRDPTMPRRRAGRPAVPVPTAFSTSLLFLGGLMKVYLSIAAGVLILGACVFLILRPRDGEEARPEVAASLPAEPSRPEAPPAEEARPVQKAAEPAPATEPAPEKKEEPLASVSGKVLDEKDVPVPSAEVSLAIHPAGEDSPLQEGRLKEDWLRRSSLSFAVTDASGAYSFEGLSPGKATLSAFKEGFSGGLREVEVKAGEPLEGMDLKISAGKTLRGIVVDPEDRPVADAIVSVYHAWNPKDMAWGGSSLGLTGEDGRFAIGLPAKAELLNLRVNSETLGQDFFLEVAVTGEEVRLKMKERATLRGRIEWEDGSPAEGVLVFVRAEVPEPKIPIWYSGWRLTVRAEAAPNPDGSYEIGGLQPGFEYEAVVVEAGPERLKALLHPLSPRGKNRFCLSPGEVKTWDYALARPISVHGTIRSERSGTPIQRARIGLKKDGKEVQETYSETNAEGSFRIVINTGPGRYLFYARPDFADSEEAAGAIAERFGKTLDLKDGEDLEVDLQVFEPIVLPIRVLDAGGKPVGSIRYELSFQIPNGRRFGRGDSTNLDAEGRTSLALHFPVEEIKFQVSAFPSGPLSEPRAFRAAPGTVIPEQTFVLERTCDISGVLLDPEGKPHAEENLTVDVTYGEGKEERFGIRTDKLGAFAQKGLRASTMTIRIRGEEGAWKSETLDGSSGSLDLGQVALEPVKAEGKDKAGRGSAAADGGGSRL